jgi:serine/threonine protein phosphatase PrpC
MEDAVIHEVNIGDGNLLFAVFDGHGGNYILMKAFKLVNMFHRYL